MKELFLENKSIDNPQLLINIYKNRNRTDQRERHVLVETNLTAVYQIEGVSRKRWVLQGLTGREANREDCCEILYTCGIHTADQDPNWVLSIRFLHISHTCKCGQ